MFRSLVPCKNLLMDQMRNLIAIHVGIDYHEKLLLNSFSPLPIYAAGELVGIFIKLLDPMSFTTIISKLAG